MLGRKTHISRNHSHISNNHVYRIGMLSSFRECGKVPPELAVLPPEDIRDQEFGEERRQWREPCARGDMTDDVRQQENILSSCEYRVDLAQETCTYNFRLDMPFDRGGYIVYSLFRDTGRFDFSWIQVSYLLGELVETG